MTSTDIPNRRGGRAVRITAILGLAVVAVAALLLHLFPPGASADIKNNPPPRLYSDASLRSLPATDAARRSGAGFAVSWADHHPKRDDKQFVRDLIASMPPPPNHTETLQEIRVLHGIRDHHDAAGDHASKWLEIYGKKKIWKLYMKQHKALLHKADAKAQKQVLGDALGLAATVQASAKNHFQRQPPYQQDPTLRGLNQAKFAKTKKYSYPAKHAAMSYAAVQVLEAVEPHRSAQFEWMAEQVAYARLYGAGHFPSDIVEGAYVGAAVGEYELAYSHLNLKDLRL